MSSLGCPVVAAVSAASGCQQPVFAQLRRGTHTPSGSYPIVKLRNPNDEKSSSGQIMKSFDALSFPRHAMPVPDHSCFVIIFNETDQSSDFAIFASLSFSRDE